MRRKISALLLSAVMVFSGLAPGGTKEAYGKETESTYEYEEVSVKDAVSNSWHVTNNTSGDGGPEWAFDGNSSTHWHSNYTADVKDDDGNIINRYADSVDELWGEVSSVPEFFEIEDSRVWIGGSFDEAVELGKLTYEGRKDASKNWLGQYALYVANAEDGAEPSAEDFELVFTDTNTGHSMITIQLEEPVEATHFRIAAFTATGTRNVTASEIKVYEAVKADTTPRFGGSIVDTDTQYTQDRLSEVSKLNRTEETLTAWKNDKALSEIVLYARYSAYTNVSVTAGDLKDDNGNRFSKDQVTATFIKSTKAYNGKFLGYGSTTRQVPADNGSNRSESSDILYQTTPMDMESNTLLPVWIEFAIPEDAEAGTYTGSITVTAEELSKPLEFVYTIKVQDAVLPDAEEFVDSFDIMQWQYPYTSAEYYDVTPFSEEHLDILRSNMQIYKEIGGNAITATFTEEAWSGQTYSKNEVHYPSMVKWTRENGTFSYDYTDLDAWIGLCKEMGLGEKIVFYGIAPWHGSFTYWENDQLVYEKYTVGNDRYVEVWTDFLTDFTAHLDEMGWLENAYIGIDERGVSSAAFDVAEAAGLKTAADIDNITNHWEIAKRVTDLNVGDTAAQKYSAKFAELLKIREEKGYKTTLYSCTEHQPGQFSLSSPVESYWAVLHAGKMGADGFNRWAYDAWVEDPLNDTTHNAFEPGDCFVIYPDEKDAENPTAKYSVRLARMAEGIRDVNKLKLIAEEVPELSSAVNAVFADIQYQLKTTNTSYMSKDAVAELSAETAKFKEDLEELTEQYIYVKNGGTLDTGLSKKVAYYSFDEENGHQLINEWGDDRNGTIAESAAFAEGREGNALSVNTAGEGALVTGDYTDLDNADWTVGYWVKASSKFDKEISVLEDSSQKNSLSLRLADNRDKGGFRTGDGAGDVLTYNYTFKAGKWYYITWVQEKSTGLSLYVNGEFVQTNAWTASNAIKAPLEVIGGTGFTGLIDEVKIYAAVLTQQEINEIMGEKPEEISMLNKLTKYTLPEKYQSNVEGAASDEEGTLVGTSRQYLGQPDMIRTETGRLITVFPEGHGHGPLVMKYSEDDGENWYEVTTPESWKDSQETPTLYTLDMEDGSERLILICACPGTWGNYTTGWDYSYSDDDGETWSEFEHFWLKFSDGTSNGVIVGMASLVQLKDENGEYIQKWMGVYHNGSYVNYKTYLTFDAAGNAQWSEPEAYLSEYRDIESSYAICEVGLFRSPDGNRIVGLARNQTHAGPATMFWSDDEGETWSEPAELPGSLAGERHKALYDPITGKLVITFREIDYDRNKNGVWEGGTDWTAGEWVAWVGTYEDLMNFRQGEYMIVLDEDFSNNYYSGDTGYTGMVVLDDGTFIMDSYGHWDETFSGSYKDPSTGAYNVTTDLCWIRQAKFNLYDLELELGIREEEKVERLFGSGRYETAYKAADAYKEILGKEKFKAVIVATGNAFADALSGSYLASVKEAPILLTSGKETNVAQLHDYIKANVEKGGTVYILGGTGAVPETVDQIKTAGYRVIRIAGASRYETSLKILTEAGMTGNEILVATGKNFADSLSASATGRPIMLVKPGEKLSAAQKTVLQGIKNAKIYIVGGNSAVSKEIEDELTAYGTVTRIAGTSRYETSVKVAETFFKKASSAVVASGKKFPDGLCGGPLAAALNAPLILTKDGETTAASGYIAANNIRSGYVLGGTGALSDQTVEQVFSLNTAK